MIIAKCPPFFQINFGDIRWQPGSEGPLPGRSKHLFNSDGIQRAMIKVPPRPAKPCEYGRFCGPRPPFVLAVVVAVDIEGRIDGDRERAAGLRLSLCLFCREK